MKSHCLDVKGVSVTKIICLNNFQHLGRQLVHLIQCSRPAHLLHLTNNTSLWIFLNSYFPYLQLGILYTQGFFFFFLMALPNNLRLRSQSLPEILHLSPQEPTRIQFVQGSFHFTLIPIFILAHCHMHSSCLQSGNWVLFEGLSEHSINLFPAPIFHKTRHPNQMSQLTHINLFLDHILS